MARELRLTLDDETLTVAEWSHRTGIRMNTIHRRMREGLSASRILAPGKQFSGVVQTRADWKRLTMNGETLTVSEWARKTGVSIEAIYRRIRHGWSDERCIVGPSRKSGGGKPGSGRRPGIFLTMDGETLSVKEWSANTGLTIDTIYGRIRKGWSTRDVLTH